MQAAFEAASLERRRRRLLRSSEENEEARLFEMPRNFVSRIVRKNILRQVTVARGSGERTARGSHFHRIEFPCILQSAAKSMLWDISNKSGPHICGMYEVHTWEVNNDNQEELDSFCSFHELRTGKKASYYSGTMRMKGKVFVKMIPPFICEHKTNFDDVSTLVVTFYTVEINRFGGVSWPTNTNLYATDTEYTEAETHAWALLYRFTTDWRAPMIMHDRFMGLARRARRKELDEDIPMGDSTEHVDSSTSMESEGEASASDDGLPRTQPNSVTGDTMHNSVDLTVE